MSQFNQSEKDICCAPDLWSSTDYSIRQLIKATASVTMNAESTTASPSKPLHSKKLIPSFSVSSFCPSLSDTTNQSQSSSQQGTPPSPHFPVHKKKPIKSAMRRSCVKNGKAPIHPSECIPSGLAGGSIVMPTGGGYQQMQQNQISSQQQQHHQSSNNANGYISPQYGWYISMTPPTPPHYHDSSQINKKGGQLMQPQQQPPSQPQKKSQNGHTLQINNQNTIKKPATYMTTATNGFVEGRVAPPKPVFTRSLKGVPNNTSGWPSVPL